jgi:hypothetical protein
VQINLLQSKERKENEQDLDEEKRKKPKRTQIKCSSKK